MRRARILVVAIAATIAMLCVGSASANGDLFFEAQEIPGDPRYVIFGSVKDDRGKYISGALVTISVHEPRLAYTAETNVIGRFRTLDIGRAIEGLGYEVDGSQIQISVEYPGYREQRRLYRGRRGQSQGAVEVNFILVKDEN